MLIVNWRDEGKIEIKLENDEPIMIITTSEYYRFGKRVSKRQYYC